MSMPGKKLRIIFWSLGIIAIGTILYYAIHMMIFVGVFDTKYTREELTENFTKHEKEFEDLTSYFSSKTNNIKDYQVSFKLEKKDKISLDLVWDEINNGKSKRLGGNNLDVDSPQLDSALVVLGWSKQTAIAIREKLSKINFDKVTIINRGFHHNVIIYPYQNGWGSFDYIINDKSLADSVANQALSKSKFGRRVQLSYSSAL